MDEHMTIFYSNTNDKIQGITGGVIGYSFFGEDEEDMKQIYGRLVIEIDEYVLSNSDQFKVIDGSLKLLQPDIPDKYL